jgi:hypothetical protein
MSGIDRSQVIVRQDDIGCYVKHGDDQVRPIAPAAWHYEAAYEGQDLYGGVLCACNATTMQPGYSVLKLHSGGVHVRIKHGTLIEVWYIHNKPRGRP